MFVYLFVRSFLNIFLCFSLLADYQALLLEALKALSETLKTATSITNYDEEGVGTAATALPTTELNTENCTLAFVTKDSDFTVLENDALSPYVFLFN